MKPQKAVALHDSSFHGKDAVYLRKKLNISTHLSTSLEAVYESFIISQTSRGISDATITNYHSHLRGIAKHLDITMPFHELSKRQLEERVVSMREVGLAHICKEILAGLRW